MTERKDNSSLILRLIFPGFSYPSESRFVKYCYKNNQDLKKISKKKSEKSLIIEPENIKNGNDKRTTIILKNLPDDISKEELKAIIEPLGNINFIYIPLLIKNKNKYKNNLPCAYVNAINYKTIIKIFQKFQEIKLNADKGVYNKDYSKIEIFYSGTQGKKALINRFRLEKKYLPPNQMISFS